MGILIVKLKMGDVGITKFLCGGVKLALYPLSKGFRLTGEIGWNSLTCFCCEGCLGICIALEVITILTS